MDTSLAPICTYVCARYCISTYVHMYMSCAVGNGFVYSCTTSDYHASSELETIDQIPEMLNLECLEDGKESEDQDGLASSSQEEEILFSPMYQFLDSSAG